MKIGIITYHFARNYGAVLQCYALQRYLLHEGHEAEILNYISQQQERNNSLHRKRNGFVSNLVLNMALLPFEAKRRRKEERFETFLHAELRRSPRIRTLEELSSYIELQQFDAVVSGSDQVFNPRIADFDSAFLFPFDISCRKASFAASTGGSTKEDLERYAEFLKAFDALCVRERASVELIEGLCGKKPIVADDPVFLLDKQDWLAVSAGEENFARGRVEEPGYVLGYYLKKEHSATYLSFMNRVAQHLGVPLKVVQTRFEASSFRPEMIVDAGPREFLQLLSGASFVCTDSFHGTAFSLLMNVPFVAFEPSRESSDHRKRDLLESLNQQNRVLYTGEIMAGEWFGPIDQYAKRPECQQGIKRIRRRQESALSKILGGEYCQ